MNDNDQLEGSRALKLGCKGTEGFQRAADLFSADFCVDIEIKYSSSSKEILRELMKGNLDYGVVSSYLDLDLRQSNLKIVNELALNMGYSLFTTGDYVDLAHINILLGIEDALNRCKDNAKNIFGNITTLPIKSTIQTALMLQDDVLDATHAILCRKEVGMYATLHMVKEFMNDKRVKEREYSLLSRI